MAANRAHGHYCKVCGQHKANEKFSGKGHASHICKACAGMTAEDRAEAMALTRLSNLPLRRLTDSEKKWLENRTHDRRPAVKELAGEVYRQRFPHAERNALKKQLRINRAEFTINSPLWDEYGDETEARRCYVLDRRAATLSMRELDGDGEPDVLDMDPPDVARLLKWMVHGLEIFCWEQDYCGEEADVGADFDIADLPGFEFLRVSSGRQEDAYEPTWSVWLQYADGHEQRIENHAFGLPDRVEELYRELNHYFAGEDDEGEFDFIELAFGCADLIELAALASSLLADAEDSQSDVLLLTALTDLLTMEDGGLFPPEPGAKPYRTYSGARADLAFMRSFLVQGMAGEEQRVFTGKERLLRFIEFVRENIVQPRGELISVSDLDKTMNALEKKYRLIRRLSNIGTLQIMRIPNSHKVFDSICNAVKRADGAEGFRYELYLFHNSGQNLEHPVYILLHEIGHALQVEITHDPAKIPQSFCALSDKFLRKPVEQGAEAKEFFADAFAIAMMQTFGWEAYDPFLNIAPEVKKLFQQYMDWLIEKEFDSAKP